MLYQLHEFQRAALEPWRWWAQASAETLGNPLLPFSYVPNANKMAASLDLMLRLTARYERPAFDIQSVVVDGTPATVTEEVWIDTPFCQLLHFRKSRAARNEPVVLVFAPLSGHFSTLLRDTVKSLLPHHGVVITDWKNARDVPLSEGPFHFDTYVEYVQEFIRVVRNRVGRPIHAMSVCQPTVPVLAGVALMAARGEALPASLTMMGGPIDTRKSPTQVNDFATHRPLSWFEQNVIQRVPVKYDGAMRRVYPGFMQLAGFIAMNPDRHFESHVDYYHHLVEGDGDSADAHRRFYDEYNAVMDLPAEYYLETIVRVFHEQRLARGTLEVAGEPVRPETIKKCALFTIEGELDDISGCGQTQAAHDLCKGLPAARRQHYTAPAVGHYGIFSGRKFRETIYPRIRAFVAQHA
ncbi:MAG: polyhydroxyalkanoate depolymerase [Betaproteobacteria bacterium]|nr:polyhydroxyalkanoate depolymerase [Betaproteobacteria bacterium]